MTETQTLTDSQSYTFQAETRQLLDLMIHSLYSNKEIFLRELISNASDALDRLRFEALSAPELAGEGWEPRIRLEPDAAARTLTVHDNGIGMSRGEVIEHIGTIAKSGTRELMERVKEAKQDATIEKLIGQFGVGFYSSFMVADQVELVTRRAGEEEATHWRSSGGDRYEVGPAERAEHGTSVILHLKPADEEAGLPDFTEEWTLRRIVKRYSDFVAYPVLLPVERDKELEVETAEGETETKTEKVTEEQRLNSQKPIWARDEAEVTEDDYKEFYKHVSGDWNDPMERIAVRAEGRFEYRALLFVPGQAPYDLFYVGSKPGLQLYVRRVQIMEACEDLLPHYLRFVKGVVESPDLPLNVSREMLQQDRHIKAIEKNLAKKVLDRLAEMAEKEPERYHGTFWPEFGRAVKEGASQDYANRERLLPLLRFSSSHDPEKLTSLAGYVSRMKPDQEEMYYITAESREVAASSPHLEAFRDQGYEVLFLVDPVDELLVQTVHEFDGKRLKSIGKGTVELGSEEERKQRKEKLEERETAMRPLLDKLQGLLDATVKHVRLSARLTSSPACLVGAEHDYSPQLERLLQKGKGGGPQQRRILELNPDHPVVAGLARRYEADAEDSTVASTAQLLLGYAYLAEGSEIPDPVGFNARLAELMEHELGGGGAAAPTEE
jgi:molecular chaperone HtpG